MIKYLITDEFLNDRLNQLEKITTKQELNALLEEDSVDNSVILKHFTNIVPINDLEANLFLLKVRENSVGSDVEYMMTCDDCKMPNNFVIDVSECIDTTQHTFFKNQVIPFGLFDDPSFVINNTEAEKLSVLEYNQLGELLTTQNNQIYNSFIKRSCRKCNNELEIEVIPRDIYSKSTLQNIYREYIEISMFTNNGKLDIDSMYPFEREIFTSLIADKMKDDD